MGVLPHDALERHEDNLWTVEGSVPKSPLRRRMSVIRMSDNRLLFHSPMLLNEDAMQTIESLGTPAFVVIPNGYHRIDAANYAARYPDAQIIAPKASEKRVSEVVRVDANYDAIPSDPTLSVETLEGCKIGEGVFVVSSQGGTSLVFNDMVFNVRSVEGGFARFMLRMVGSLGGPKVTRVGRTFMVNDKNALASHFARLAMLPNLKRLIPGHGDIVTDNVADALKSISASLG